MKIEDRISASELFCKDVFHDFLIKTASFKEEEIKWIPKPNGESFPPDYGLSLDEKQYAVEITEIKIFQRDGIEKKTFMKSREYFAKVIEEEALALGKLNGEYCLFFLIPWAVPLDKKIKSIIREAVFRYYNRTKEQTQESPEDICLNYQLIGQIFKLSPSPNKLFISFADGAWPESDEMQNQVCARLQNAIDEKKEKLDKVNVPAPRVLLLLNSDPFSYKDIFKKCLKNLNGIPYFHTIFIVSTQRHLSFVLYSNNSSWK